MTTSDMAPTLLQPQAAPACRPGCGACCTAPSITSPIPGMPNGKPAGVRCAQLADDNGCRIFGRPERPAVCGGLQPSHEMCGDSRQAAIRWLTTLEQLTAPTESPAGSGPTFGHKLNDSAAGFVSECRT